MTRRGPPGSIYPGLRCPIPISSGGEPLPAFGPLQGLCRSISRMPIHVPQLVDAPRNVHASESILIGYPSLRNSAIFARAARTRSGLPLACFCVFLRHAVSVARFCSICVLLSKCWYLHILYSFSLSFFSLCIRTGG